MGSLFRWVGVVLVCGLPTLTVAQLTITSPVSRMVFQRNLSNEASVTIAGIAPSTATAVEARFVPLAIGQGAVTAWTPMRFLASSSAFRGKITAIAGWYRLDVRAKNGTTIVAQTNVNRVGVGEVFIVAGQSNAYGGFQRVASAADDRVMCVDFRQDSLSEQLLPLRFSHVSYGSSIGPSQPPHLWGMLGDKLTQRLNVPVLFLGAALGGTTSSQWYQSAAGNIGTMPNQAVYRRMGVVLLHYIARTGARAVLWHQGEGDLSSTTQQYYNNINYVISKTRAQTGSGSGPLAWVVSRVSYISGQTNPLVIAAQNQLISNITNVFAGPATDSLTGPDNRADDVHLQGPGLIRFTNAWNQSLTTAFFQNAVPFMPTDSAALITSGYTLPLTRRPGETIAVASLRNDPHESDNQYVAQVVRTSDGVTIYESDPSTANPILVTLPFSLPNGQYRLRTRSTHPVIVGTLGEPFNVQQDATPAGPMPVFYQPVSGGAADTAIHRLAYGFEYYAHAFYAMVQSSVPVEVRLQRIDGGSFGDSGWNLAPPSSQAPDRDWFADFNYLRNYPPISGGVGGVEPGKYRLSVRRQGDTGNGLWYEMVLLDGRQILYQSETIGAIPPVLTLNGPATSACLSGTLNVAVDVSDGTLNSGNVFSVRLSDANGSFANETTIGSGTTSPVAVTLSPSLPAGTNYRIRVVASNPAVASAPSPSLTICNGSADLAMNLSVNSRTPVTNQPVTITLVLTNNGPADATNVTAKSLLPTGMDFVDTASPVVSASANAVSINAGTILSGASKPFAFRVKASQPGIYATTAQITASSQPDPDSQPNSGTGDGQDDQASVDLRTPNATGSINVSPNPNQNPLPTVQSNQPPTDPAKADLSLSASFSQMVVASNQVIQLTLTAANRGGATANNVTLRTLLPTGWQLTVTTGLTISGQTVTGNMGSIAAGSSGSIVLFVQVPTSGTLQAQVLSASPSDTDSTPGNGYANGEDDEVAVSVRVR